MNYKDLLKHPTAQGARVLSEAGIDMSEEIKTGMADWIDANKREHRAAHKYTLEDFGLSKASIEMDYAAYIAAFVEV